MSVKAIYYGGRKVRRIYLNGAIIWGSAGAGEKDVQFVDVWIVAPPAAVLNGGVSDTLSADLGIILRIAPVGNADRSEATRVNLPIEPKADSVGRASHSEPHAIDTFVDMFADAGGRVSPSEPAKINESIVTTDDIDGRASPSEPAVINLFVVARRSFDANASRSEPHFVSEQMVVDPLMDGRASVSVQAFIDALLSVTPDADQNSSIVEPVYPHTTLNLAGTPSGAASAAVVSELDAHNSMTPDATLKNAVSEHTCIDEGFTAIAKPTMNNAVPESGKVRCDVEFENMAAMDYPVVSQSTAQCWIVTRNERELGLCVFTGIAPNITLRGNADADAFLTKRVLHRISEWMDIHPDTTASKATAKTVPFADTRHRIADDVIAAFSPPVTLSAETHIETGYSAGVDSPVVHEATASAHIVHKTPDAEISFGRPFDVDVLGIANISARPEADTGTEKMTFFAGICRSGCDVSLSCEPGVEYEWYDPVKIGNTLYIRSAWSSYCDGDKLFIDVGEWYEAIRNGSNLHIRSVCYSWQDNEKAYIDLSVFYEPRRIGNGLYIRSANSVRSDSDGGNIHM